MARMRVNEIDLLRFIAALAVVFYHYSFRGYAADDMTIMPYLLLAPFTKYGYLGVELFFMISGFVILMTAAEGSIRKFLSSRITRLYPAFWACCTITFAATVVIGAPRYYATWEQYFINMTMMSGFYNVAPIDGAYWSLFIEMRFYALVTFILAIGKIKYAQLLLGTWLISSAVLEVLPIGKLRYLLITDYSPYFIAGATFFLIWARGPCIIKLLMIIFSFILALRHSIAELSGFEVKYNVSMSSYAVSGIVALFFIVMLLVSLRRTSFIGRYHWRLIGGLTYLLYLLHQNIGFMIFNLAYPTIDPHVIFWGTGFTVLGTAYVVHVFLEKRYSYIVKNVTNNLFDVVQRQICRSSTKLGIRR